jgi:hypothetical protein
MKILKPGEKTTLSDGRVVTFLITNNPDCFGCVFCDEDCTKEDLGLCGSGRPDGNFGIFVECKK